MKLFYRSVSPWNVRQVFGANQVCIDLATGTQTIACDGLNPPPGYRSVYGPRGHLGLDLRASLWQPVYGAREGVVTKAEYSPAYGNFVEITHDFGALGRWKTRYCHLVAHNVSVGERVWTGQLIGYAGTTGISTAVHLHFELEQQLADGTWVVVDPAPLLFDDEAKSINFVRLAIEKASSMLDALSDRLRAVKTRSA